MRRQLQAEFRGVIFELPEQPCPQPHAVNLSLIDLRQHYSLRTMAFWEVVTELLGAAVPWDTVEAEAPAKEQVCLDHSATSRAFPPTAPGLRVYELLQPLAWYLRASRAWST